MLRVLFVSNGHGEAAIAERIGAGVRALAGMPTGLDHLALVGGPLGGGALSPVGPRRAMPSGGLVAMGNVRNFARDLRAGFARLFFRQIAFLRKQRGRYDAVVAVGDVYAFALASLARADAVFVGTAKSVYVAPYGPAERAFLRRAARVFVRDEETARWLQDRGVAAEAPGNVIADLSDGAEPAPAGAWLGVLPGSRESAYADAVRLARVVRALGGLRPVQALLSVAPTLDAGRLAAGLARDGWTLVSDRSAPFAALAGGARLAAWDGPLGPLLRASYAVLGAAGTGNEQAAGLGVPVIALEAGNDWYRMRQRRLLGDALLLVPSVPKAAAAAVAALLADPARLARMRAAGRERMGPPGGSAAIARAVLTIGRDGSS